RVLLAAGPDGRLVAVKQVLAHFADDEGFRARFRREVTASRKVSGAYTAAVIDADPDAPTPWLASVFVAGPSLGAVVKAVGVLPEDVVRRLAAGLTSALAEIHRAGLVHRDLKPDNVLLAEDGVRVIDLGIARATEGEPEGDTGLTRTGFVVGSPAYMSPEQAEGHPLTPASDVFSLGSVLVMALTGRSPAGTGTALYVRDRMNAPIGYTAVPGCKAAGRELPLELVPSTSDSWSTTVDGAKSSCNGGADTAVSPKALVRWDLSLGGSADVNAVAQKRRFQSEGVGQREAPRLGFGTEAYWGAATADWTCVLAVREGNLSVWVGLRAKPYTKGACETKAKDVARAALKASTRR
ncbi:serine/threonine-protein kinase, partial [Streptomyces sp. WAC05950]|uniref:serine/threonine-protein kinase n=1 Tax=Streptomyces sp. WAC05950 TaxID=2487419 RepID=UPI0021CC86BD